MSVNAEPLQHMRPSTSVPCVDTARSPPPAKPCAPHGVASQPVTTSKSAARGNDRTVGLDMSEQPEGAVVDEHNPQTNPSLSPRVSTTGTTSSSPSSDSDSSESSDSDSPSASQAHTTPAAWQRKVRDVAVATRTSPRGHRERVRRSQQLCVVRQMHLCGDDPLLAYYDCHNGTGAIGDGSSSAAIIRSRDAVAVSDLYVTTAQPSEDKLTSRRRLISSHRGVFAIAIATTGQGGRRSTPTTGLCTVPRSATTVSSQHTGVDACHPRYDSSCSTTEQSHAQRVCVRLQVAQLPVRAHVCMHVCVSLQWAWTTTAIHGPTFKVAVYSCSTPITFPRACSRQRRCVVPLPTPARGHLHRCLTKLAESGTTEARCQCHYTNPS